MQSIVIWNAKAAFLERVSHVQPHLRPSVQRPTRGLASVVQRRRLDRLAAKVHGANDVVVVLLDQSVIDANTKPACVETDLRRLIGSDDGSDPTRYLHRC